VNAPHSLDSELPDDDSSSSSSSNSSNSNSSSSPVRRRSSTAAGVGTSTPDLQVVYGEASSNTVNSTTAADAQQHEAWPADKDKAANALSTAATAAAAGATAASTAATAGNTTAGTDDQRCWW
jgi:hypothetical protein